MDEEPRVISVEKDLPAYYEAYKVKSGYTWNQMGALFGIDGDAIRRQAISQGLYNPRAYNSGKYGTRGGYRKNGSDSMAVPVTGPSNSPATMTVTSVSQLENIIEKISKYGDVKIGDVVILVEYRL